MERSDDEEEIIIENTKENQNYPDESSQNSDELPKKMSKQMMPWHQELEA